MQESVPRSRKEAERGAGKETTNRLTGDLHGVALINQRKQAGRAEQARMHPYSSGKEMNSARHDVQDSQREAPARRRASAARAGLSIPRLIGKMSQPPFAQTGDCGPLIHARRNSPAPPAPNVHRARKVLTDT